MQLEATIADIGALLVQLHKFTAGVALHGTLLAETMALGDRARRHLRARSLDAAADAGLEAEAASLHARATAALDQIRRSPAYRDAAAAHASGDHAALARLLPELFAGLSAIPPPPFLWHPIAWLRRNRPRAAADIVTTVRGVAAHGLEGDGEPTAPGLDPALPAVPLDTAPTGADPVLLRWAHADLPPAVFRRDATGELLVHVPRLIAPFTVVLPTTLDEDELGELSVDHQRYRAELVDAFAAAGIGAAGG